MTKLTKIWEKLGLKTSNSNQIILIFTNITWLLQITFKSCIFLESCHLLNEFYSRVLTSKQQEQIRFPLSSFTSVAANPQDCIFYMCTTLLRIRCFFQNYQTCILLRVTNTTNNWRISQWVAGSHEEVSDSLWFWLILWRRIWYGDTRVGGESVIGWRITDTTWNKAED